MVGSLVVFRSLDAALAPVGQLRGYLIMVGLGGTVVALTFSLVLTRSVTRPVGRLLTETERLGAGDLDRPIEPMNDDEIGMLASGFERMRVSLREARAELIRGERLSAVGQAASALVHDFAQPVTLISAHTELLALGEGDEAEQQQEVAGIRDALRRLQGMMREVLEFARGEVRIEATEISVQGLLEAVGAAIPARPAAAAVQLGISGEVDVLALSTADERGLNRNFHGDGPFSALRMRLFGQHWVTERIGVFTELLFDIESDPRIYGAYVVVNELAGQSWLNARLGLAPSPLGNFGLRDTYFTANPLIGVPLHWQHRTTLDGSGLARNEDLIRRREQNVIGFPILYVACWSIQWELLGYAGPFEYSVALTSGSPSNPSAADEDGVAFLGRAGLEPVPGIRFGVSAAVAPYLGGRLRDAQTMATSYPGEPKDYLQRTAGYDLEISTGRW